MNAALLSKRVVIVSLHFSPAHASHLIAFGKLLRSQGAAVTFLLDEKYCTFADFSAIGPVVTHIDAVGKCEIAIFYNSSVQNPSSAKQMWARGMATVLYIFHEPESIWNMFPEGMKQMFRFFVSSRFSVQMLRLSSGVIMPSLCAMRMYNESFRKYNGNAFMLPLLLDDEIGPARFEEVRQKKHFFGFVGNASRGHGIDEFVAFVKHAVRSGSTIPFQIATKTDLSSLLNSDNELARFAAEGRVHICHGRPLPNDEINERYLESFCVWNLYRRSTQSGVLVRAFMAGTPVLARKIGSFQDYVQEGITGEFVDSATDCDAILRVAEAVRAQSPKYVGACRKMFLETFYYQANSERLAEIIGTCSRKG